MANMRVVYDNAADRCASLVASSTAGTLAVSNLQNDLKSQVWRSTSNTSILTLTWTSAEQISCVALPFTNLTASATIRVKLYTETADVTPVLDTGNVFACPSSQGYQADLDVPLGVNYFAYGGYSYADIFFAATSAKKIEVILINTGASGYVEAARLVVGKYWSPANNVENESPKVAIQEDSKHERADSGDLHTDRGPMYRKLTFDLGLMTSSDRNYVWRILRGNGMSKPVYLNLIPDSTDVFDESIHSVFGKLASNSAIQYKLMGQYATSLQFEEL